jgi:hypothetical protein
MNWLKKGPELKLSEMKIPDFVYDLFYDLKERHLLPLVAVLLMAMVAVPIWAKSTASSDSESEPLPSAGPSATASTANAGGEGIVVARSAPGLRNFKRRLKGARALDPFAARGQEVPPTSETQAGEEPPVTETSAPPTVEVPAEATVVGAEPSYSPPAESTYSPPEGATPIETPLPVEATGGKTRTRYESSAIDVRIVSVPTESAEAETKAKKKPTAQVRRNLPELTMLPARATPAATFMGTSRDGKKALMLISSDVVSIFGEANCVIGSQSCQLLALEPGLPETFVYGPHERTFRIELLKINRTLSAKPRRATLGATVHKAKSSRGTAGEEPSESESAGEEPAGRG